MKIKKRRQKKTTNKITNTLYKVLLGVGILAVVAVITIFIINAIRGDRDTEEVIEEEPVVDVGEPSKPQYELGDADSDKFDFSGEYFDRAGEQTNMTIVRGDEAGSYTVSILHQENDISTLAWEIEAVYDSDSKSLSYEGCTHMRYLLDPEDLDADPEVIELSGEGTGHIFKRDNALFWLDDAEDMGSGMLFTVRTAE